MIIMTYNYGWIPFNIISGGGDLNTEGATNASPPCNCRVVSGGDLIASKKSAGEGSSIFRPADLFRDTGCEDD